MIGQTIDLSPRLRQTQTLSHEMRQGLDLLQRPMVELRDELQSIMSQNPVIEDIEWKGESVMSAALPEEHASGSVSERELDFDSSTPQGMETLATDDADRDGYLMNMENYEPSAENGSVDPDARDRRQAMFDRQVRRETLQEHLRWQIALSDIPPEDRSLAETLVGSIDDDGMFVGSVPDVQMVTGASEERILATLARIGRLDPMGCGGRDLRECLLAQMEKLDDSPWEDEVRALVDRHLQDLLEGRRDAIMADLGLGEEDMEHVLCELRKLARKPGLAFSQDPSPEIYVEPEVFAFKTESGRWKVRVPERNVPTVRISGTYRSMLSDPATPAETKAYLRERIGAAEALVDALAERQETIRKIGQAIVDRQGAALDAKSLAALKPLTMEEVAQVAGVHNSTVSRTVRGKYMATPLGVVEMRRFFVGGVGGGADGGAAVSSAAVTDRIRRMIEAEDAASPLSDQAISDALGRDGVEVARRTVAKYRESLGIPGARERRKENGK